MAEECPKEEIREIYEALPDDLKEALFSEETAADIRDICVGSGVEEKNLELAKYVGYVLLGLLPPDEFEKTLTEKLALKNDLAKKISRDITRLVFLPVKTSLEMLYKTEIKVPTEPPKELPEQETPKPTPKTSPGKDIYRELIE